MNHKDQYSRYVATHHVPLFFKPFWLEIHGNDWHVVFEKEGEDFVFFVYSMEKKMRFKMIRNGFLTPYSGFLFPRKTIEAEIKRKLTEKVLSHLPVFHELHLDLHPQAGLHLHYGDFAFEKKITNILDITDMKSVYAGYKPALKRQINKASKTMRIAEMDDIRLFYRLHEKTFEKQNAKTALPFAACKRVWEVCKTHHCGRLLFAIDNEEQVHAALFLTYDDETAYYLAGGTDAKYYGSGAMSLLMHEAIQLASGLRKKHFDFEGSMLPGVNKFFTNFSPVETPYLSMSKMDSMLLKIMKKVKKR